MAQVIYRCRERDAHWPDRGTRTLPTLFLPGLLQGRARHPMGWGAV